MQQAMLAVFVLILTWQVRQVCMLSIDFYAKRCPATEKIVSRLVWLASRHDPSLPAALLRLHYHDCFVGGCEGSVLLDSAYGYPPPEKMAPPNQSLRGFNLLDSIKSVLEAACPLTVSCADILALAAREAVTFAAGGPRWEVPTGRRDGRLSSAVLAVVSLPHPQSTVAELKKSFLQHGMSEDEMFTLLGAHTIGLSHCASVWDRLYNYNNAMRTDPSMDSSYAEQLKRVCPRGDRNSRLIVPLDPDNVYYKNLERGIGLLASDQILYDKNHETMSGFRSNSTLWEERFREAMIHLSILNVMVGFQGEIRRNCHNRN